MNFTIMALTFYLGILVSCFFFLGLIFLEKKRHSDSQPKPDSDAEWDMSKFPRNKPPGGMMFR